MEILSVIRLYVCQFVTFVDFVERQKVSSVFSLSMLAP